VAIQYKVTEENSEYIDFVIKNIVDEFWSMELEDEKVINVIYETGTVISIFEGGEQGDRFEERRHQIIRAISILKQYTKTDIYAGIGDVAHDAVHLHVSLRHALRAAGFKIFEEGNAYCIYRDIKIGVDIKKPDLVKQMKPIEEMNIFAILEAYGRLAKGEKTQNLIRILESEYEEMQSYLNLIMMRKRNEGYGWVERYKGFHSLWSMSEARRELKERAELAKELSAGTDDKLNEVLMKRVLEYIEEHITEEIDLMLVADKFNRTSGYISTFFKRYTGYGFNTYLTKERVEIAKKLLEDSSIPIQEVGRLCGYSNPKYFSVVFKKVMDMTPKEYRQKVSA
jgi:two-component system response regulator YesN